MIYSINIHTKEHRIHEGAYWKDDEHDYVRANEDGWITWHGHYECPLPAGHKFQCLYDLSSNPVSSDTPEDFDWYHHGDCADIVAYRPIFDEKDHMKSSQADPHPKDVRDMLSTWHDTGVLADDSVKVLKALEQYKAVLDACFYLPGCDIIVSGIVHEIISLERIIESRGYQKEN